MVYAVKPRLLIVYRKELAYVQDRTAACRPSGVALAKTPALTAGGATERIGLPEAGKVAAVNVNTAAITVNNLYNSRSKKIMKYYRSDGYLRDAVFSHSPKKHNYACLIVYNLLIHRNTSHKSANGSNTRLRLLVF